MNRVVLGGRLAERPRISASSRGIVVAALRLQVPRQGGVEPPPSVDEIDCLAFEKLARRLHLYAEAGAWVNLEGFLLPGSFIGGDGREYIGYRVAVETAYWLDPRQAAPVRELAVPPAAPAPATARPDRVTTAVKRWSTLFSGVQNTLAGGRCRDLANGVPASGKAGR